MVHLYSIIVPALWTTAAIAQNIPSGASSRYVAPDGFPSSVFSSYWVKPNPTAEPQVCIDL